MRNCIVCGAEFAPSKSRRKICSDECQKKRRVQIVTSSQKKNPDAKKQAQKRWRDSHKEHVSLYYKNYQRKT